MISSISQLPTAVNTVVPTKKRVEAPIIEEIKEDKEEVKRSKSKKSRGRKKKDISKKRKI